MRCRVAFWLLAPLLAACAAPPDHAGTSPAPAAATTADGFRISAGPATSGTPQCRAARLTLLGFDVAADRGSMLRLFLQADGLLAIDLMRTRLDRGTMLSNQPQPRLRGVAGFPSGRQHPVMGDVTPSATVVLMPFDTLPDWLQGGTVLVRLEDGSELRQTISAGTAAALAGCFLDALEAAGHARRVGQEIVFDVPPPHAAATGARPSVRRLAAAATPSGRADPARLRVE